MKLTAKVVLSLVVTVFVAPQFFPSFTAEPAAESEVEPPWHLFKKFVGKWKGKSQGRFGPADLEKSWSFALKDHFLQCRTESVAQRDLHQDWSMLSYDKKRKKFVLREFHSEGYVNQYVVAVQKDGREFVYETESVENAFAPGLRAQTIVRFVSDNEIQQTFALASPGKKWDVCVESTLRRQEQSKKGD